MKPLLTAGTLAGTARMVRTAHAGAILLTEGDTDARVFKRLVEPTACHVLAGTGKSDVLAAIQELETAGVKGVLGIVDADFWHLEGTTPDSAAVLLTDSHDLETVLLGSRALDDFLDEFGAPAKVAALGTDIRQTLLTCAAPIGYLRWIADRRQTDSAVNFHSLSFRAFFDAKAPATDEASLIQEAITVSPGCIRAESDLLQELHLRSGGGHDLWQVCCGHDLVKILWLILRFKIGNRRGRKLSADGTDGALRLAFSNNCFVNTRMCGQMLAWEKDNTPYKVLGLSGTQCPSARA